MTNECETPEEIRAEIESLYNKLESLEQKLENEEVLTSELRQKEKLLKSVFEVSNIAICITNEKGLYVEVNDAYCKLYGYDRNELIGKAFTMVVPEDRRAATQNNHDEFIAGKPEIPVEWQVLRKDGSLLTVVVTEGLLVNDKGSRFKITTVTDLTSQKKAQEHIKSLGRILEQSYNEIFICDESSFRLIQVNRGARNNLGYSLEELMNMSFPDIFLQMDHHKMEKFILPLRKKEQELVIFETLLQRKDASFYSAEVRLQLMQHENPPVLVAIVQENTEQKKLMRIQEELRLASMIQRGLMPSKRPEIPNYDMAALSVPSKEVGGDYYDAISTSRGKVALCVGDIAGKGMPAALLMANLQAAIRGQTLLHATTSECLYFTNKLLYHNSPSNRFATFFYGILDPENNVMEYSNAGHNLPLLFRKGNELQPLRDSEIVLGVIEEHCYIQHDLHIGPGDILLIYSDGISEAINSNEEEFGEAPIIEIIQEHPKASARELIDRIFEQVSIFTNGQPPRDDMTLLIMKRTK